MLETFGLYWKTFAAALMPVFLVFQELNQDGAMTNEDWAELIASLVMTALVWAKANTVNGQNVATTPAHVGTAGPVG